MYINRVNWSKNSAVNKQLKFCWIQFFWNSLITGHPSPSSPRWVIQRRRASVQQDPSGIHCPGNTCEPCNSSQKGEHTHTHTHTHKAQNVTVFPSTVCWWALTVWSPGGQLQIKCIFSFPCLVWSCLSPLPPTHFLLQQTLRALERAIWVLMLQYWLFQDTSFWHPF